MLPPREDRAVGDAPGTVLGNWKEPQGSCFTWRTARLSEAGDLHSCPAGGRSRPPSCLPLACLRRHHCLLPDVLEGPLRHQSWRLDVEGPCPQTNVAMTLGPRARNESVALTLSFGSLPSQNSQFVEIKRDPQWRHVRKSFSCCFHGG